MRVENFYAVLGVPNYSSIDVVRQKFKELAKKHHPDIGGEEETMKQISNAYNIIKSQKNKYDAWLKSKLEPQQHMQQIRVVFHWGSGYDGTSYTTSSTGWY